MSEHFYYTSLTSFFMGYLDIPDSLFASKGIMTKSGMQACVKYLIEKGVFVNEDDMKKEVLKDLSIILPNWIFEYDKEHSNATT